MINPHMSNTQNDATKMTDQITPYVSQQNYKAHLTSFGKFTYKTQKSPNPTK